MANPQPDKFTRLSNELLEALSLRYFHAPTRVFFFIMRKTYGWGEKTAELTLSEIADGADLDIRQVPRALNSLERKKLILRKKTGRKTVFSIQKDYDQWTRSNSENIKSDDIKSDDIKSDDIKSSEVMMNLHQFRCKNIITSDDFDHPQPSDLMPSSGVPKDTKDTKDTLKERENEIPLKEFLKEFASSSLGKKAPLSFTEAGRVQITRAWGYLVGLKCTNPAGFIKQVIKIAMREMLLDMEHRQAETPQRWFEPHVIFSETHFQRYFDAVKAQTKQEVA